MGRSVLWIPSLLKTDHRICPSTIRSDVGDVLGTLNILGKEHSVDPISISLLYKEKFRVGFNPEESIV